MAGDFEGIKQRNFGIEIEMTGITRCQAANAISSVFGGEISHDGGYYDKYTVGDSSIEAHDERGRTSSSSYSVELNSPVLEYNDIPLLQEVIRALRRAGGVTGPTYRCGTHLHISADDFTPRQLINLVNIFSSKEDISGTRFRCPQQDQIIVRK